jgi:transcriptional antiterminator RfaH
MHRNGGSMSTQVTMATKTHRDFQIWSTSPKVTTLSKNTSVPPVNSVRDQIHWYAVHTKPRAELLAQRALDREHIQTFYPKLKQRKTIRRVRRWITSPLFPSYIFARFDLAQSGRLVQYANGVANLVSFGGKPAIVEDQLIHIVQSHCTQSPPGGTSSVSSSAVAVPSNVLTLSRSNALPSPAPFPDTVILEPVPFKPGEKVTIATGPLMGFQGIFEKEMSDRDRVVILLDTIGKASRVQVSREQLEKTEDQ